MAIGTQSKLLRSIQERRIRPVGAVDEIPLNVRFIAATNRRVEGVLKEKKFREDLYHRLNVIQINMPALRDMPDEIPDLLQNLLASKSKEHQRGDCEFDMAALAELQGYSWPGNIREATNIVERCLVNTESGIIGTQDLPVEITTPRKQFHSIDTIPTFDQAERDLVVRALRESNGNKSQAAELLGISRPRLYKKIEQYDIDESSL
jgi:two-component system response regulator HydG